MRHRWKMMRIGSERILRYLQRQGEHSTVSTVLHCLLAICLADNFFACRENCDLLMDLLVAIAAANKKGDVDKKFPTYQKNEETGLYPHAEHVLRRSNSMSNSTGGSTFI